jgi:hypothetical protein
VETPGFEDGIKVGEDLLGLFEPALQTQNLGEIEGGQGEIEVESAVGIEVDQLAEDYLRFHQSPFRPRYRTSEVKETPCPEYVREAGVQVSVGLQDALRLIRFAGLVGPQSEQVAPAQLEMRIAFEIDQGQSRLREREAAGGVEPADR